MRDHERRQLALWTRPPGRSAVVSGEVHVWRAFFDVAGQPFHRLLDLLSDEEREQAARGLLPLHRRRAVASRGGLRRILARYLDADPRQLRFACGPNGKPSLDLPWTRSLAFNLSHSCGVALVAVTAGAEVGVDLERVRPSLDVERIADRFFASEEAAALKRLPHASRPAAFFAGWTRKEALLKAKGGRIGNALRAFRVSLDPDERLVELRMPDSPGESAHWSIRNLFPGPGWSAAVAVRGRCWELRRWEPPWARATGSDA